MSRPSPSRAARSATTAYRGLWATAVVATSLTNSTFTGNGEYAAYLNFNVGHLNASGNGGSGNAKGVVVLNGTLAGKLTLALHANLHSFDNSLTVNAGASLDLTARRHRETNWRQHDSECERHAASPGHGR